MKDFIQYVDDYKLGAWSHDSRYLMSVIGEVDDMYVVFLYDLMQFSTQLKRDVMLLPIGNDINFKQGWCIRIKGVDHHINGFQDDLKNFLLKQQYGKD